MSRPPHRPKVVVRRGRYGLELRIGGTLATLLDETRHGGAGIVWQGLAAPVLSLPPQRRRRFLLLGLGGGGVARALRAIAPEAEIVGVELEGEVIAAAREHLGLDALGVEVVHDSADRVLRSDRRRYDAIVEDIFVGTERRIRKPAWLLEWGYTAAWRRLRAGGVLVSNTIDETSDVTRAFGKLPGRSVALDVDGYHNTLLACGSNLPPARALRALLRRTAAPGFRLDLLRLRTL